MNANVRLIGDQKRLPFTSQSVVFVVCDKARPVQSLAVVVVIRRFIQSQLTPAKFFTNRPFSPTPHKMADILSVPTKKTSEVDLVKPFKNLISLRFSSAENPENSMSEAISEFHKLRNNATLRALDKNETSIDTIAKYLTT